MWVGALRLSILSGLTALGAVGVTLALVGLGLPFLLAAVLAAVAAGLVHYAAARSPVMAAAQHTPPARADESTTRMLADYRQHTAAMRHDLRGVLSPALMMSDRLVNHSDPAVQRAGHAVVRSVERATALLADSKDFMTADGALVAASAPEAGPADPALQAR